MPNWCHNRVTFSGTGSDIDELTTQLESEESPFDFNNVIPMPEELRLVSSPIKVFRTKAEVDEYNAQQPQGIGEAITHAKHTALVKKYGHADWYTWSINNWGCKWNNGDDIDRDIVADSEYGYVQYDFETPWGPPVGIYQALCEMYPDMGISWFYDEPGMEFAGYLPD